MRFSTDIPCGNVPLPALFGQTAILTHASPAAIRRARTLTVAPLTVQVFASASARRAGAVAASIDAADDAGDHGFIDVGGFPANNTRPPHRHVRATEEQAPSIECVLSESISPRIRAGELRTGRGGCVDHRRRRGRGRGIDAEAPRQAHQRPGDSHRREAP